MNLSKYNKFWVALATVLAVLVPALAPTESQLAFHVTTTEWYQIVLALAGALGVYRIPNDITRP